MAYATRPLKTESLVLTILLSIAIFLLILVLIPFVADKKMRDKFPNNLIAWFALLGLPTAAAFLLGAPYDFEPERYEFDPYCAAQSILVSVFGTATLFVAFFYVFSLKRMIINGRKPSRTLQNTKAMVLGSLLVGVLTQALIPLAFPHTFDVPLDDPRSNQTVVFGAQGPWCLPKRLEVFVGVFYTILIPPAVASLYFAPRILLHVWRTSSKAMRHQRNSKDDSERKKRQTDLYRFYVRVVSFIAAYAVAIIIGFFARLSELSDFDPDAPNDPTMGASIIMPLILFFEGLVFITMPKIIIFYRNFLSGVVGGSKMSSSKSQEENATPHDVENSNIEKVQSSSGIQPHSLPNTDTADNIENGE